MLRAQRFILGLIPSLAITKLLLPPSASWGLILVAFGYNAVIAYLVTRALKRMTVLVLATLGLISGILTIPVMTLYSLIASSMGVSSAQLATYKILAIIVLSAATFTLVYTGYGWLVTRVNVSHPNSDLVVAGKVFMLLRELEKPQPLARRHDRADVVARLESIADFIQNRISSDPIKLAPVSPTALGRFSRAATYVRGLQVWATLPQARTVSDLREELLALLVPLVTGYYHYLPDAEPSAAHSITRRGTSWRRIAIGVGGSLTPAILIYGAISLGWIPPEWRQVLTATAVITAVLGLSAVVKPNVAETIKSAQEVAEKLRARAQ